MRDALVESVDFPVKFLLYFSRNGRILRACAYYQHSFPVFKDDSQVRQAAYVFKILFIFRTENLIPIGKNQHVILAAFQMKSAFFVKPAEVAGIETSVLKHRLSAQIAQHHARCRDGDLAVILYADVCFRTRIHGIRLIEILGDRDTARRFRKSITEIDLYTLFF